VTESEPGRFTRWIDGARPRTWPASLVPVLVGTLAIRPESLRWNRMVAAAVVALAMQIGTNYANDYSDGIRGTDATRVGPVRLVGQGLAAPASVRRAAVACFAIAGLVGLWLCSLTSWWLVLPGIAAVVAGWLYTGGPKPYGYLGLGELFVFVFFGLFATIGSGYVQDQHVPVLLWLASIPVGLLATALLEANNLRDISGDRLSSKRTLAVRLGRQRAGWLYGGSLLVAASAIVVMAVIHPWCAIALVGFVATTKPLQLALSEAEGRDLLPMLKATGQAQLCIGVLLALGLAIR